MDGIDIRGSISRGSTSRVYVLGLGWRRRARTEAEENVFDGLFVRSTGGETFVVILGVPTQAWTVDFCPYRYVNQCKRYDDLRLLVRSFDRLM